MYALCLRSEKGLIDMIKIIGALLIIGAAAKIGFDFASRLETRRKCLVGFKDACIVLESEIEFMRTLPREAFFSVSKMQTGFIGEFFEQVYKLMDQNMSISQAWEISLSHKKIQMCLTERDIRILCDFANRIGKSDTQNEIKNIQNTVSKLELQIHEATNNCSKKNLYRSGGVLIGLLAVVLLL